MPHTFELRLTIMRLARRMRQEKAAGEVAEGQRSVLFFIYDNGPQSLGSLSEHDRVTPPSMNRTINHLLERGYVSRQTNAVDARKVSIDLTDDGRRFVEETRRIRNAWFDSRLADLDENELAALKAATPVLRKLADS